MLSSSVAVASSPLLAQEAMSPAPTRTGSDGAATTLGVVATSVGTTSAWKSRPSSRPCPQYPRELLVPLPDLVPTPTHQLNACRV